MKTVEYGKENQQIILLLHGGGLSWWNYKAVAERLADRFRIVMPILDGHSGSDAPFTSIEDNAGKIIAYIDENFEGHVLAIGGLSLGGQILIEILSQRSDICKYAIIESAVVKPMGLTAALIKPAYALCYPLIRKKWFSKLQFRALHIKEEYFEYYFADTTSLSKEDMIAFLMASHEYQIKDTLGGCRAKTLVAAGGREASVVKKSASIIADHIPESKILILKDYYHGDFSINHSGEYAGQLCALLSDVRKIK